MIVADFTDIQDMPHFIFTLAIEDFDFDWCSETETLVIHSDSIPYIEHMLYEDKPTGVITLVPVDSSPLDSSVPVSQLHDVLKDNYYKICELLSKLVELKVSFRFRDSLLVQLLEPTSVRLCDIHELFNSMDYTDDCQGKLLDNLVPKSKFILQSLR